MLFVVKQGKGIILCLGNKHHEKANFEKLQETREVFTTYSRPGLTNYTYITL